MNHLRTVIGLGILLTGGCELADIGTEVKYVGPFQTARPFDCRMQMTFGPLPYLHQDIARAKTECPDHLDNEELCFDSCDARHASPAPTSSTGLPRREKAEWAT